MSEVMTSDVDEDLVRIIERELNLGQRNPHELYERLENQLGTEKLLELASPYLPDLISDMARQRMNQLRRNAIAKITDKTLQDPEVMLKSLWVPSEEGIVYKRIADMTADDFRDRAGYLDRMVVGIAVHAAWCREVASQMDKQGVAFAKDLDKLPSLPELE